jgi:hypothetical protein
VTLINEHTRNTKTAGALLERWVGYRTPERIERDVLRAAVLPIRRIVSSLDFQESVK